MATDFFERQDAARKRTGVLATMLVLGILGIGTVISGLMILILGVAGTSEDSPLKDSITWQTNATIVVVSYLVVAAVVLGASGFKYMELRRYGGEGVARSLGGKLIPPHTSDPQQRQVLNVVEEMCLAAGMPVPPVYLLSHEKGINAFAAGFTQEDAVIGVTQGCVDSLTRDELQGVMAHEIGHVMSGDTRINLRVMGVVFGMVCLVVIGRILLLTVSGRRSSNEKGGNPLPIIGLVLIVAGFIGIVFSRIMQAAISRQREYLADAQAVQFTRNPTGLSGALKRIGGGRWRAHLDSPHAEEANHMFFAEAGAEKSLVSQLSGGMMASHPKLEDRIRRLEPDWDGKWLKPLQLEKKKESRQHSRLAPSPAQQVREHAKDALSRGAILAAVGTLDDQGVQMAQARLAQLPEALRDAAHDPEQAPSLMLALFVDQADMEVAKVQLDMVHDTQGDWAIPLSSLAHAWQSQPPHVSLMLIEMAMPALKYLEADSLERLLGLVDQLIAADKRQTLYEWSLRRALSEGLHAKITGEHMRPVRFTRLNQMKDATQTLLSAMAYAGSHDQAAVSDAFAAGRDRLGLGALVLQPAEACRFNQMDEALDAYLHATMGLRKRLLEAVMDVAQADERLTDLEKELLRAFAASLGIPVPPA